MEEHSLQNIPSWLSSAEICISPEKSLRFAQRYIGTALVKNTSGTRTFLGKDLVTGRPVILKIASRQVFSEGAHQRLSHEAAVLRQLGGDAVAAPLYFGVEEHYVILVSPFIPGITLEERLQSGRLPVTEVLRIGVQLMAALHEVHENNILHSDIKPSNLILSETTSGIKVKLIDFGFAWSSKLTASLRDHLAGTVAYLSPESAGLLRCGVDERSDLYSAGVLLYEALSGTSPFEAPSIGEMLRNHLTLHPPSLREIGLDVPRSLDEVIQHLIKKDPRDRYQTASGALADLKKIEEDLRNGIEDPAITIGKYDQRHALTEPTFIGRRTELSRLRDWWHEACRGEGGLVFVESPSGGGKTRFLAEFSRKSLADNALIYWGQGIDQAAQRPFQVLADVAQTAVRHLIGNADERTRFLESLGDKGNAARTALPESSPIFENGSDGNSVSEGPETFGEIRSLEAMVAFLDSLGSPAKPALIILDDSQWADDLSLKLIQLWHRRREINAGKKCHVCLVAAFRTEEVLAGHFLRRIRPKGHLTLSGFAASEIESLIESMAGKVPEEAVQTVVRLAEGSPFMASAILRGLVESGTLVGERSGWRMESTQLGGLSSSRVAATFLVKRLELLPDKYLELLSVGAVLGKEFEMELAALLSGQSLDEAWTGLEEARRRHILWSVEKSGHYAFVHDKLREALLQRLTSSQRRSLHLKAAKYLLEYRRDCVFELAYHFDCAGDSQAALPFALKAAERARGQHSLEIALQQYRIAQRGDDLSDPSRTKRIAEGIGDVLLLRGEYEESEAQFQRLRDLSNDTHERSRIEGKLGEIAFKRGDVDAASQWIEGALRTLDYFVPSSNVQFLLLTVWEVFIQALHSVFPRWFLARRSMESATEANLLPIRLFSRLAYVYWFQRGKVPCAWAHFREMNLAERYPPTPELAQAYSEHAPVLTMFPYFSRGIRYAKKSLEIRRRLGDVWGQGQSLHFYGVVLYSSSRYEEGIEKCREAMRLLERTGDRWEVNTAHWHLGFGLYRLGELRAAADVCRQVYQAGQDIADHQAAGIALSGWSRATQGKVPRELIQAELERNTGDAHTKVEIFLAEGVRLLNAGQPADAVVHFRQARALIRKTGLHQEYVAPIFPWLVTGLRREWESSSQLTPFRRQALLKEITSALREALRISKSYQNNLPHALREAGLVSALEGKLKKARRYLDRSLEVAQRQGARYEEQLTLTARAEIGKEASWKTVEADISRATKLEVELCGGNEKTSAGTENIDLSRLDRFETLLQTGRQIASSLTAESVYESVKQAALKLLRAEKCIVFICHESELIPVLTEGDVNPILKSDAGTSSPKHKSGASPGFRSLPAIAGHSRKLVSRAVQSGMPEVWVEGLTQQSASDSILLERLRSALCAPFRVRSKVAGCFYVVHHHVGALFGEEEKKLAGFIAALAGVALENAAGFTELEELSRSREHDNQTLRSIQKELALRNEELSRTNIDLQRFAHVVSHDLKEPLRMVNMYVKLIEQRYQQKLDDDGKEFIKFAAEGANRMIALIDALLAYTRVSSRPVESEHVCMNEVIDAVLANLKMAISESGAEIKADGLPRVEAKRVLMIQLFQNLIGNSIKYRGTDPPVIQVEAKQVEKAWLFSVKDNGIGIERDYWERIFIIFQRLHLNDQYPGTGIGLAISKRIIEIHRGKIWVESEPGRGSTFFFTLPSE